MPRHAPKKAPVGEALRFLPDGQARVDAANIDEIRDRVRAKHEEKLAKAGFFGRLVLRLRMRREVARALAQIAPPDALYATPKRGDSEQ